MATAMVMVMVMDTTALDTMGTMARERLKLQLNQNIAIMVSVMVMDTVMDTTAMDIMVTMARERLSQVMDTMDNFRTKYLCCAESSV